MLYLVPYAEPSNIHILLTGCVHKYDSIDAKSFLKEKVDPLPKLAVQLMNGNYGNSESELHSLL